MQSGVCYGPFHGQTDLIIYRPPVSRSVTDNADVDSTRCCTNSDLEDEEMGNREVARHPYLNHCNCSHSWNKPSADGSSETSPAQVRSGSPALLLRAGTWGT